MKKIKKKVIPRISNFPQFRKMDLKRLTHIAITKQFGLALFETVNVNVKFDMSRSLKS